MEKNDKIMQDEEFAALVEQYDNAVVYEITNLFKNDKGEYRSKQSMRDDPPVLIITDKHGSEVEFKLTEELTGHLLQSLKAVNKGYHGYGKHISREIRNMSFKERLKYELKNNTLRAVIAIVSILGLISLIISGIIGG